MTPDEKLYLALGQKCGELEAAVSKLTAELATASADLARTKTESETLARKIWGKP